MPKLKRSRSSISQDNVNKRARTSLNGGESGIGNGTMPRSPASSSRSRSRKGGSKRSREKDSNVKSSATSGSPRVRNKPQNNAKGAGEPPSASSFLKVNNLQITNNIVSTNPLKRAYGQELQMMMHAFGEVRFPCRDVLEMIEDITRETVKEVVIAAAHVASDEALRLRKPSSVSNGSVVVSFENVLSLVEQDAVVTNRLLAWLHGVSDPKYVPLIKNIIKRRMELYPSPIDALRDLEYIAEEDPNRRPKSDRDGNVGISDATMMSSYRMMMLARGALNRSQFMDFRSCREVNYLRTDKRRPGAPPKPLRFKAFQDWLDIPASDKIVLSEESLLALGHIAWEITGTVTQNALMYRHFDEIAHGNGDPRISEWTLGRHIIAALRFGTGTAVCIPVSSVQLQELLREMEKFSNLSLKGIPYRFQGYGKPSSASLLPKHVRESYRRLQRVPGQKHGLASNLVHSFLGRYIKFSV